MKQRCRPVAPPSVAAAAPDCVMGERPGGQPPTPAPIVGFKGPLTVSLTFEASTAPPLSSNELGFFW